MDTKKPLSNFNFFLKEYIKSFIAISIILIILFLINTIFSSESNSKNIIQDLLSSLIPIFLFSLIISFVASIVTLISKYRNKNIFAKKPFSDFISVNNFKKEIVGEYRGIIGEINKFVIRMYKDWGNTDSSYGYINIYIYFQNDLSINKDEYLRISNEINKNIGFSKFMSGEQLNLEIVKGVLKMNWCYPHLGGVNHDELIEKINVAIDTLIKNNFTQIDYERLKYFERTNTNELLPRELAADY